MPWKGHLMITLICYSTNYNFILIGPPSSSWLLYHFSIPICRMNTTREEEDMSVFGELFPQNALPPPRNLNVSTSIIQNFEPLYSYCLIIIYERWNVVHLRNIYTWVWIRKVYKFTKLWSYKFANFIFWPYKLTCLRQHFRISDLLNEQICKTKNKIKVLFQMN